MTLLALLREIHEAMDDAAYQVGYTLCRWCQAKEYDSISGVLHKDSCLLLRLRKALVVLDSPDKVCYNDS